MPTAVEYRVAAGRYRMAAENMLREAGEIAGWTLGSVVAGPVRAAIDESLECTRTALIAAGDELARLAAVCDARADTCAQFARRVQRYRALTPAERLLQRPPSPPARWVEL